MPGILVNNTVPNLASGVSQQFTEARFSTQVEDMINCMPSLSRGILRRNPLSSVATLAGVSDTEEYFSYSYDRGTGDEQYIILIGDSSDWAVYNANTGTRISFGTDSYFAIPVGESPINSFDAVTIGDFTFIVNKTVTVAMSTATADASGYEDKAFYWIKKTTAVLTDNYTSNTVNGSNVVTASSTGSRLEGYTYNLEGQEVKALKETRSNQTAVSRITAEEIASNMASKSGSWTASDSFVYATNSPSTWTWSDSFGDEASVGVKDIINKASRLPAKLPAALSPFKVKISGASEGDVDDYYLEYVAASDTWSEITAPGEEYQIDSSTMPKVLIRGSNGLFTCDVFPDLRDRTAGNDESNPQPSFIGNTIESIFFHKNRLGFITKDSVVLSEVGEYGNFFGTTVQTIPDSDPIDLAVATTDVTRLKNAVSTSSALILFSDDAQFTLASEGVLTPVSATINTASRYTYSDKAKPAAIGNKVYFISESGGFSQLFAYNLADFTQSTAATPLTSHIPSYITTDIFNIQGHSVLGYNFFVPNNNSKQVYVLTNTSTGTEDLQNAFHKWEFSKDILNLFIIKNRVYFLFTDGTLSFLTLELPGDITSTDYRDFGTDEYTSSIEFSKFHVKDASGNGTSRGRLQLRTLEYTITDNSVYKTTLTNKTDYLAATIQGVLTNSAWDDTNIWDDSSIWIDTYPIYSREYVSDKKVTVGSSADNVIISFTNDTSTVGSGFELFTINIEAFYHQRSNRLGNAQSI